MTSTLRAAPRLGWLVLLLLSACEQLGNPALRHGHTEPITWRAPGVELVTSSQTFPSENATEILRALPRHQVQQVEPFPAVGATVTLVAVEIKTPRRTLPYTVRFQTVLTLPDGRVQKRSWQGSGQEVTFYAALLTEQAPLRVSTRLR